MSSPGQVPPAGQQGRGISGATIVAGGGLAALLVFMLQNTEDVKFDFLWFSFTWPLWLYTIVVALFGAAVWLGLGVLRRHRRRALRRRARLS